MTEFMVKPSEDNIIKVDTPLARREDGTCWPELERGEFAYIKDDKGSFKYISFWPFDCTCALMVPIAPNKLENGASWNIDIHTGGEDRPTLNPSIDAHNVWHGWLKLGVAKKI